MCVCVSHSENRTAHLTGEYTRLSEELESQKLNLKVRNTVRQYVPS
jgi:hypothetical protein